MTINQLFEEARRHIAVPDGVLKEARKRRDTIREIVEEEFDTLRTLGSGSLAHGTQNDPLNEGKAKLARRLKDEGEHSVEEICSMLGVGRSTLYRYLAAGSKG